MKFKVGDVVTPKNAFLGSGREYVIDEILGVNSYYKLDAPRNDLDGIDLEVINCKWYDSELNYYLKINGDSVQALTYHPLSWNPYKTNLKEETNMKDILDIYAERKRQKIEKEFLENLKEIREVDEIQHIHKEMFEQIKCILDNEGRKLGFNPELNVFTKGTIENEENLKIKKEECINNLKKEIEEINALLLIANNFEEKMAIFKNYGIIDKKGKLNV